MTEETLNAPGTPSEKVPRESAEPEAWQPSASYRRPKWLDRPTVMIALMFFGGLGWVALQREDLQRPSGDPEMQRKLVIEAGIPDVSVAISSAGGGKNEIERLSQVLTYTAQIRRIPIRAIPGNPFVFQPTGATPGASNGPGEEDMPNPAPAGHLQLEAVLFGSPPTAIINGQLLSGGQIIDGWTVIRIESDQVVLQWRESRCVLKFRQRERGSP